MIEDVARRLFAALVKRAGAQGSLPSDRDHFNIEGTLVASKKSFKPKNGPPHSNAAAA